MVDKLDFTSTWKTDHEYITATDLLGRTYAIYVSKDQDEFGDEWSDSEKNVKMLVRDNEDILAIAWGSAERSAKVVAEGVNLQLNGLHPLIRLAFETQQPDPYEDHILVAKDSRGNSYQVSRPNIAPGIKRSAQLLVTEKGKDEPFLEALLLHEEMAIGVANALSEYLCPASVVEQSGIAPELLKDKECHAVIGVVVYEDNNAIKVECTGGLSMGNLECAGVYLAEKFNSRNAALEYVRAGWKSSAMNIATVVNDRAEESLGSVHTIEFRNARDFFEEGPWQESPFEAKMAYLYTDDGWVIGSLDFSGSFHENANLNDYYEMHVEGLKSEIFRQGTLAKSYLAKLQSI